MLLVIKWGKGVGGGGGGGEGMGWKSNIKAHFSKKYVTFPSLFGFYYSLV